MMAITRRFDCLAGLLPALLLLVGASTAQAASVFTGQTMNVTFQDGVLPDLTDAIIAGDTDPDIAYLDGSNIGDGIMLDFEFIDFADTSVTFSLRGDGGAHPTTGYQTTGLPPGSRYVLSLTGAGFSIGSVSIGSLTDMTGVAVGSEVTFDASNIYFDISALGILEVTPGPDIGSVTLNVEFVPVPAALPLMLSGLAGLALIVRRRKPE